MQLVKRDLSNQKSSSLRARQNAQSLLNQANKELEKLDKEHADLEKLEDAIQADIERLSSSGGVAPSQLSWPVSTGYVSSGYGGDDLAALQVFMELLI